MREGGKAHLRGFRKAIEHNAQCSQIRDWIPKTSSSAVCMRVAYQVGIDHARCCCSAESSCTSPNVDHKKGEFRRCACVRARRKAEKLGDVERKR